MQVALVAAVVGIVLGYATGGRLRNLGEHRTQLWPLLVVGVALQVFAPNGVVLVAALLCLLAWAVANAHLVGMGVVVVGLVLNTGVIAANGAMPVRANALERAGVVGELDDTRKLQEPGDRLTVLGDVLPVPPLRQVLSFGDLIVAIGTIDVVAHLMRRRRSRLPAPSLGAAR